ncbi:uncharacterized protein LOC112573860 isoform X3 [Pomacea canaliculata]|uniref:uncharacterized protein LOC112573860 isoform X3 n=1 Tax=Pomacea canaliculata TaxID=400727 RepID=UPI000D72EF63|nr:uncharacterized protein LOC112573860 isoform X3 [Pomacea canaliculata]
MHLYSSNARAVWRSKVSLVICTFWSVCAEASASLGSITTQSGKENVYLYIGEMLELNCTLNPSVRGNASDLTFDVRNNILDESQERISKEFQHVVDNFTLQLRRVIESEHDAGSYNCWFLCETDDSPCELIDSVEVAVQWRPQKVENITCFVYNWDESLTCQWNLGVQYLDPTKYENPDVIISAFIMPVSYHRRRRLGSPVICPSPLNITIEFCVWTGNMGSSIYQLVINVTNTQRQENSITSKRLKTDEIIKPSPVQDLWLTNKTSSCISAAWNHARMYRKKIYHVQVFSRDGQMLQDVTEISDTSHQFCGLNPYTAYRVSVTCKPKEAGFWSEGRNITVITEEAVPSQSFSIHPGSYVVQKCSKDNIRNVTLYFMSIPEDQRNGKIIGYQLQYNGRTVDVDREPQLLATVENIPCNQDVLVHIFARNKAGLSNTSSAILIHAGADSSDDFSVELSKDELFAVWDGKVSAVRNSVKVETENGGRPYTLQSLEEMTIFWCEGDAFGDTKQCETEIEWNTTSLKEGRMKLPIREEDSKKYIVGFSFGNRSIIWASCLYKEDGVPPEAPKDVRVVNGQEKFEVQWQSKDCSYSYPYHITGYTVQICETSNCAGTTRTVPVEGGSSRHTSISAIPGFQYNLSLQAVTSTGEEGPWSESTLVKLDENSSSGDVGLLGIPFVAAAATALVASIIVCIVIKFRQCMISRKAKFQEPMFKTHEFLFSNLRDVDPRLSVPSPNSGQLDSPQTPTGATGMSSVNTDTTYLQQQTVFEEPPVAMEVTYMLPNPQTSATDNDNIPEGRSEAYWSQRSSDGGSQLCNGYTRLGLDSQDDDGARAVLEVDRGINPQVEVLVLPVQMSTCDITHREGLTAVGLHSSKIPSVVTSFPNPKHDTTTSGYIVDVQAASSSVIGHSDASPPSPAGVEDKPRCNSQPVAGRSWTTAAHSSYVPVTMACTSNTSHVTVTSPGGELADSEQHSLLPSGSSANLSVDDSSVASASSVRLHGGYVQAPGQGHVDPYVMQAPVNTSESSDDTRSDPSDR